MEPSGNTVLVTGGASGIGLIAERFLRAGSEVAVCGWRTDKLREAREKPRALWTRVADVAEERDRAELFDGTSEMSSRASRAELDEVFQRMNGGPP